MSGDMDSSHNNSFQQKAGIAKNKELLRARLIERVNEIISYLD